LSKRHIDSQLEHRI